MAAIYRTLGSRAKAAEATGLTEWQVRCAVARVGEAPFPPGPSTRRLLDGLDWPSLYREHGSYRKVAAAVGCSPGAAKDRLIAAGVKMGRPRRQWTYGEVVRIAKMVSEIGPGATSRALGVSRAMVWKLLGRLKRGPGPGQTQRAGRIPGLISRRAARRAECRGEGHRVAVRGGNFGPGGRPRKVRRAAAKNRGRLGKASPSEAFLRAVEAERRRDERESWGGCLG